MRNTIFILCGFFLLTSFVTNAQGFRNRQKALQKIEQLEKMKLIETLDMNEETTLKFFSRRKDFKNRRESILDQIDKLAEKIETEIKDSKLEPKSPVYTKMIDDYIKLDRELDNMHLDFIVSLRDILTEEQIAKFILFERKFREEIQDLILKGRRWGQNKTE